MHRQSIEALHTLLLSIYKKNKKNLSEHVHILLGYYRNKKNDRKFDPIRKID